jgi:rod shape-determining protein MreD
MKKIITLLCLSVLFAILDNALMPFLSIKGVYPSLLFTFAICYSIINGSWSAVLIGILSGILQDIYLMGGLGINLLLNMLICLIAAKIGKTIFKDKSIIPIISCFLLSLLKGISMFVILYIIGQHVYFRVILYRSIYSIIVAIFVYKRVYNLCKKSFMVKNWKF